MQGVYDSQTDFNTGDGRTEILEEELKEEICWDDRTLFAEFSPLHSSVSLATNPSACIAALFSPIR
jgi:hypothetical protein